MDGFITAETGRRKTLKASIGCVGVGLHSGRRASVTLHPAAAGTGIVFRRSDLGIEIPALFDRVTDTRLCTAIGEGEGRIGTIEHVMAALAGCGVDDAVGKYAASGASGLRRTSRCTAARRMFGRHWPGRASSTTESRPGCSATIRQRAR